MSTIEKRQQQVDLSDLSAPQLSEQDWRDFREGVRLFNEGRFWESHEAWEEVWKRHQENSRIFLQGLIQAAAALHQLRRYVYHGADKHLRNALWKLEPFQPVCLGIDVQGLVQKLNRTHRELTRLGPTHLQQFNFDLLPKIIFVQK